VQLQEGEHKLILVNKKPCFFYYGERVIPTVKFLLEQNVLDPITVDMGAVKFVVNGADIMRPGIVAIDPKIKKDGVISIIDVNNKKPLAVGIALYGAAEMEKMSSGKVIKNIHYFGDSIWKNDNQ